MTPARRILRQATLGQRRRLFPSVLATMVHQACESGVPVMIGVVVDQALARHSGIGLLWSLGGLAVLFGVLTFSFRMGFRMVRVAVFQSAHDLRLALTARVLDPAGIGSTRSPGALLSTATSDTNRVGMANAAVWSAAGGIAGLAVSAIVLLRASILLGLVVLIGLVPVFVLTRWAATPLERRSRVEQAAAAHAAGLATDFVTGLRVLKGLGAELTAAARYAEASQRSRSAAVRAATVLAGRTGLITVLTGAFLAVVALVGGRLATEGTISIGEFVSAIGLTQFLVGPFSRIAGAGSMWARASASATRIADVLDAPAAVTSGRTPLPDPLTGKLTFRLPTLDLTIEPGSWTGIVAPNPADATALLHHLARDTDPETGTIELDGTPLHEFPVDDIRRTILVAWHDSVLFTGTVKDNISATSTEIESAIIAADVDQVAVALPNGLDTELTERGRSLSGGQHQRVALARALAADPPILVLHDPTTAVDAVTEAKIAARMKELRGDKTTILVTSSPALLAETDQVIVLGDNGPAIGTHQELAADNTDYREAVLA